MDLQDAYSYELNPRAYTECEDTNVSLQRRMGMDMDSCAFTHGTLMRACDIEERNREASEQDNEEEIPEQQEPTEPMQPIPEWPSHDMATSQLPPAIPENPWLSVIPAGMPSAYVLLIIAIVAVLLFAMMRRRK
jgi:hypothetical protein